MTNNIEKTDGVMEDSAYDLADRVIGRKIVSVTERDGWNSGGLVLTLDNGKRVYLRDGGDCCAYTAVESFFLHPEGIDHVITNVNTEGDYSTWHILASGIPVLDIEVGWSEGSGYYSYGFNIEVEDAE